MTTAKTKGINMTEGPLFGKIILFILPLMATNLLQVCYNAADMMVVGLSTEADAVGAIGSTTALTNLVINVFIGISTGANVLVARCLGAKDGKAAGEAVHTTILLSLLLGTCAAVVGEIFCRPILVAMGNRGRLLELSEIYTRIYFSAAPFLSVTNYTIAVMRAKGDTKTPLLVLTSTGFLNVLLNLFFVLVLHMSVDGVALATLIANGASALSLLLFLQKDKGWCHFSFRKLRFHGSATRTILHIGLPAGIQSALFSVSNLIILSSVIRVNNLIVPAGSAFQPVVKANAATANLEGFLYTSTNSVYQAAISFTSQNAGASRYERVKKVMGYCYILTFCVAAAGIGFMFLAKNPILALYGVRNGPQGSLDAIAYQSALARFHYVFIPYSLLAFMEVGCGVARGLGHSVSSAVIILIGCCLMRIVWIYTVFEHYLNLESIYISYPISWGLSAIFFFVLASVSLHRLINKSKGNP